MSFFEWILQFLNDQSPKGRLARLIYGYSDSKFNLRFIDSFADLVNITDPKKKDFYIPEWRIAAKAITDSVWIEFCEATGHPINETQESLSS